METKLLKSIEEEFILLKYHWKIYCQLYDSGAENIELLNKSGSNVFQLLQKLIIEDSILTICSLTDPPKSAGKKNASIKGYLIGGTKNKEIQHLLLKLEKPMKPIRIYRNKVKSHKDLSYALKTESEPKILYSDIETSISIINKILNVLTEGNDDYDAHLPYGCDGSHLLKILAKAHK